MSQLLESGLHDWLSRRFHRSRRQRADRNLRLVHRLFNLCRSVPLRFDPNARYGLIPEEITRMGVR